MSDILTNLNAQQRRAVEHVDGPLLVLAGPGTGKTRVITHRISHRVHSGAADASQILGITFTNRAAQEMKARVDALLGANAPVRLGTFHWLCHAILRRHVHRIGLSRNFRLLAPSEARQALRRSIPQGNQMSGLQLAGVASAISATKSGASPEVAARVHRVEPALLSAARRNYEQALRSIAALDLDDLLWLSLTLLREDEAAREICRRAYREILVDEYQDTNPVQQELLTLLAPLNGTVVAVGDEDQAIYGWRQADSRGVHRFLEHFPRASIVRLDQTYRPTKQILRAAAALVSRNPGRLGVALHTQNPAGRRPVCYVADDELEEADWVAAEIGRLVQGGVCSFDDVGVLYRVNAQSRALEDSLVRRGIPYHIRSGARYYDRPEIRLVVAYLRLAIDLEDQSATALIAQVPGIGPKRLEALQARAGESGRSLFDLLADPPEGLAPASVLARLHDLRTGVLAVRDKRAAPLAEVVNAAIGAASQWIEASTSLEQEAVIDNLNELRSIVHEFDARKAGLRDFIDRLSLEDSSGTNDTRGVNLMTLHAAKGLEFPVVFISGVEEGLLPHRRSLDRDEDLQEERRLCYVGMTRASGLLYLSYAHARLLGGQALLGHASRFIGEIGSANLSLELSPRRRAKPRLASVRVGDRVLHPRWHHGTVVGVEGHGRDTLVTIEFDRAGRQRLQLCHAPLQKVREEQVDVLAG